jgi:hypothetical protein
MWIETAFGQGADGRTIRHSAPRPKRVPPVRRATPRDSRHTPGAGVTDRRLGGAWFRRHALGVDLGYCQAATFASKRTRDIAPDTRRAASDDDDLTAQIIDLSGRWRVHLIAHMSRIS